LNRPDEQPADLAGYLAILSRRKWPVLLAVVLVPLAAVLFSLRQEAQYRATSEVLLEYQNLGGAVSGIQDFSTVLQDATRVAETQARVARAPVLAAQVLRKARVENRSPRDLLDASDVTVETGADVLEFHVTDHDPRVAQRLATEDERRRSR